MPAQQGWPGQWNVVGFLASCAFRRFFFSALLVLSVVSLGLVPVAVVGQAFTTVTSWTTRTGVTTSTGYSTVAVATSNVTSTSTTTVYSLEISATKERWCYWEEVNGTYVAGDRLVGQLTANNQIDFIVMSQAQHDYFMLPTVQCPQWASLHGDVEAKGIGLYALEWVVPADGTYYFMFLNFANGGGEPTVSLTFSLQHPVRWQVAVTVYHTSTTLTTLETVETQSSVYSTQVSAPLGGSGLYAAFVAIVVLAVAVVVVFMKRRNGQVTAGTARSG